MSENGGWEQASTFVKDYLNGLNSYRTTYGLTDEYVSLVTLGHETAVKQRLSNNYEGLLQVFSELKLGGPSSLYGGLLLSIVSATSCGYLARRSNNLIWVPHKIILITDGRPTDVNVIAGPDTITSNEKMTKELILNKLSSRDVMDQDFFFVPVGNADTKFVDAMIDVSGGLKINYTHGKRLSRRRFLSECAGVLNRGLLGMQLSTRTGIVTVEDQEDILSIEERSYRFSGIFETNKRDKGDCYHERIRSNLPPLGSRVRRGPDWIWNQEDCSGPGTIIGHAEESDDVWVEWDKGSRILCYRYGEQLGYDVLIEDEPRELQNGIKLVVGCKVKPGKGCTSNQPESKPRRGVVIKIQSDKATVRWDNGHRGDFSIDLDKGELEYCPIVKRVGTKACGDGKTETTPVQVDLVRQEKKRIIFGKMHWEYIAEVELKESKELLNRLSGYVTVICVDISESMSENGGWEQASTFVKDYLNGLNEIGAFHDFSNEYVALVTFGHETAVKQRLSNNYNELLRVFSEIKLGGPSSLYGGMMLSIASAVCTGYVAHRSNNLIWVPNRIILITDGRPTDVNVIAGPDTVTPGEKMTKDLILNQLSLRERMEHDIFFVPVGNADTKFVQAMLDVSGGLKINYTHGKRCSRRCFLSNRAGVMNRVLLHMQMAMRSGQLTADDQEDILSIENRSNRFSGIFETQHRQVENKGNSYHEKIRSELPTIGSRVRRGPEWIWNQEDSLGPGTVVGHADKTDDVWIQWDKDDERIYFYRYGEELGYDVLIVDETKELRDDGRLAVGCNVRPGKAWKQPESKPRRGVVVKIESDKATVRWDNGHRGTFSVDLEEGELEYCPTLVRNSEDNNDNSTPYTHQEE